MQYSLSKIQEDALKAVHSAQNYAQWIQSCTADGTLAKAIEFVLGGYTPDDAVQFKFVEKSMVLFMCHMGEDAVPQWTIPPGDTSLNSKFKDTYKRARKIVLDQIQKDSIQNGLAVKKRAREDS